MSPLRVLVEPGLLQEDATLELDAAELHHLRVRRIEDSAEVIVLDGAGAVASGRLTRAGAGVSVVVGSVQLVSKPAATIIAVGAGDKDRFVAFAERSTELGVTLLVPLLTSRSRAVATRVREGSVERARRRAREACKQSGNPWAALVSAPCEIAGLATIPVERWMLGDAAGVPCPALAAALSVGWIIGPEGGLTPDEVDQCRTALRATSSRLADAVLRFDTAATAAAVVTADRRRASTGES